MKETPECCKNCVKWDKFGKSKWYYLIDLDLYFEMYKI